MYKRILTVIKDRPFLKGGLFSIFSFFNQGISFLLLIILANYITPNEYGSLSIFNTLVMFLGYFIALSTQGYVSVSYFRKEAREFNKDFSTILCISLCMLFFLFVCTIIGGEKLAIWLVLPQKYIWLAIFISFFGFLFNLNLDLIRIKEQVLKYGFYSCSFALFNCILTLVLVILYMMNWHGRVYAYFFTNIFFGIYALFYFFKERLFTFDLDWKRTKNIVLWGLPLIPHLATTWIKQGCDRYIINYNYSLEEVGLFSFALNLANIITMVGFAFNQTNSVSIYKILGDREITNNRKKELLKRLRNNMIITYLILAVIISIICIIAIPQLLPKYQDSIKYFIPLSIYGFFVCIYLVYCNYLFFFGKNKIIMYITFGTSLLHLFSSLLFTKYSLVYTAIIYIFTQLIITTFISFYGMKTLKRL